MAHRRDNFTTTGTGQLLLLLSVSLSALLSSLALTEKERRMMSAESVGQNAFLPEAQGGRGGQKAVECSNLVFRRFQQKMENFSGYTEYKHIKHIYKANSAAGPVDGLPSWSREGKGREQRVRHDRTKIHSSLDEGKTEEEKEEVLRNRKISRVQHSTPCRQSREAHVK